MKGVAISDTHGAHRALTIPECDVLIHAGDICRAGYEDEIVDFNDWLDEQPAKHKIVIGGNHDQPLARFSLARNIELLSNALYLENQEVVIDGIKFYGSPITPQFGDWWFMANRGPDIQHYWNRIPKGIDVLITHGPAMGMLDEVRKTNYDHNTIINHVGCYDLLQKIMEVKPKYHIFGHVHQGYNMYNKDGIMWVNASNCNEAYDLVNKPLEFEI